MTQFPVPLTVSVFRQTCPLNTLGRPLLALCVLPSHPAFSLSAFQPNCCSLLPDTPRSCYFSCLDSYHPLSHQNPTHLSASCLHATSSKQGGDILLVPPTRGAPRHFDWTAPIGVSHMIYVLLMSVPVSFPPLYSKLLESKNCISHI